MLLSHDSDVEFNVCSGSTLRDVVTEKFDVIVFGTRTYKLYYVFVYSYTTCLPSWRANASIALCKQTRGYEVYVVITTVYFTGAPAARKVPLKERV